MHAEALAYTRQTLGYPPPSLVRAIALGENLDPRAWPGDRRGSRRKVSHRSIKDMPFVFDNEKWAHQWISSRSVSLAHRSPMGVFGIRRGRRLSRAQILERGWLAMARVWRCTELEKSFRKFFNRNITEESEVAASTQDFIILSTGNRSITVAGNSACTIVTVLLNEDLPVVHVSWYEQKRFATGRSALTE
jgi:hypothetical protein